MKPTIVLACGLLAACTARGYDPPLEADHKAPEYRRTLRQCSEPADLKARQASLKTPGAAIGSLFTSEAPERQEIRTCMIARGYAPRAIASD